MTQKYLIIILFCSNILAGFSQEIDSTSIHNKNGITKPSILSVHPFGIFISRIQGNFKKHATTKTTVKISIESGNVWSAPITVYVPTDQAVREQVKKIAWHGREFAFNVDEIDTKQFNLAIDGVIKGFRGNITYGINSKHELNFGFRTFMLSKGKLPFTFFTGDDFIEGFHDNIAGGSDPFARRLFGLNKAKILYNDLNGNSLEIDNGDFLVGGLETSYYYYPESLVNKAKNFFVNFGAHLGTNLSKFNSSLDFGLSANALKTYKINDRSNLQLGLSLGALRKNIVDFKSDNVELATNDFIGHFESLLEYNFISKGGTTHSFGADFYIQTSYNKKEEFDYLIPIRNGVSEKSWFTGVSHLYVNNNYWTFLYSFTRKITTTFYLQQDLTLNNNPDIQTGVSISFPL